MSVFEKLTRRIFPKLHEKSYYCLLIIQKEMFEKSIQLYLRSKETGLERKNGETDSNILGGGGQGGGRFTRNGGLHAFVLCKTAVA